MPSALEKPRPFESQQETVKTPDQDTPEVPKYDEAGLQDMVDQSHKQIDAEQGRVFDAADKRFENAPNSVGLDEAKAAPIKQGFIGRIQNIKGKIAELGKVTKNSTKESLKPNTEAVKNREREKVMEQFQEKRGIMITNVLTSEVASQGMDLIPFAGSGKMVVESISGKTLSGKKLTGKDRIIHGAIGAGCLLLDFTGIGEAKNLAIITGKSLGLVEKAAVRLTERGALKSAALFQKTAAFMAKHPEAAAKAEQFAETKLQGLIKQVKAYRGGQRNFEQTLQQEIPTTETQVDDKEEARDNATPPPAESTPRQSTETAEEKILEKPEALPEQAVVEEVSRFAEKISNPESKALLEQNSEKFNQDVESFKSKLEQTANGRETKIQNYKEQLDNKINEIRKAKEELRYLTALLENDEKEIAATKPEVEKYQSEVKQLEKSSLSKIANRRKLTNIRTVAEQVQSNAQFIQERITKNTALKTELSQRLQNGDLSAANLTVEQLKVLANLEQQIGPAMTNTHPTYKQILDRTVEAACNEHFYGEQGEFTNENNELLYQLNRLKDELSYGADSIESLGDARDVEKTKEQATKMADEEFRTELRRYDEKTYAALAGQEGKSIEQVKQEVFDKMKKDVWEKTYTRIYSNMSGQYRASLQLIGLKESDMEKYLQVEQEAKTKLGVDFKDTTKRDFEYARYRAYYEARRTGQNIFTHVTSGERAAQIIEQHALKSSKITTPEEMRDRINDLRSAGQTTNIEENIYFTSGGGGFNYGTKIENGQPVKRELSDFAFFATTGNDILSSGRSIEVATPSMQEKGESLRGQAAGDYQSANGAELPLDNLQLVVPESELGRYAALFKQNGYDPNFAQEHLIGVPDEVVQQALKEGGGVFQRDSKVLHNYIENQLKSELRKRSKNKDKIFATKAGRQSKDAVSQGGSQSQVLKWEQIN